MNVKTIQNTQKPLKPQIQSFSYDSNTTYSVFKEFHSMRRRREGFTVILQYAIVDHLIITRRPMVG